MALVRLGGANVPLPTFPGLNNQFTGVGTPGQAGYYSGITNAVTLAASETFTIPSGTWWVAPGPYTMLEFLDPVTNRFKTWPTTIANPLFINSDGYNFRLANTTGCVIGASITSATATGSVNGIGTAINLVSCAPSSGGSTWQTIVGGAVSTTLATSTGVTTAGSGYTYIPVVIVDAPPQGGLQATAIVTSLSTGTIPVAAVQIINQGAGYTTAPNLTFVNDPRDTTGSGANVVVVLTGTGQLTGLYPINHGTTLTGVPTLSFALTNGTAVSCQATAIMNFTVTAFTTGTTLGSSVGNATISSAVNVIAAQTSFTNPLHVSGMDIPRPCRITAGISTGTVTVANSVIEDGGLGIQVVPAPMVTYTVTSTTAVAPQVGTTLTVGGVSDTSYIQPV